MVIIGDTSQIDTRYLDRHSSGLTYAMEKLTGPISDPELAGYAHLVGATTFNESVRSDLAKFAERIL